MSIVWSIVFIVSLIYGIVIKNVASGTSFYRVWFCIAAFSIILAVLAYFKVWGRFPTGVKIAIYTLVGAVVILFIFVECLIFSRFKCSGEEKLDYIVVLGAQVYTDRPSIVLKYRLDEAIDYLEANPSTKCIVSGGKGEDEPDYEAVIMKQYLVENGIASDRIIEENKSTNTVENIRFSFELIEDKNSSVGIVTNNFHMYRALKICKKQGFEVVGISAASKKKYLPNNALREFMGVVKDFVKRNI